MSFPVARPDRRLMGRKRHAEPCVVSVYPAEAAPARLLQLDPLGARLQLLKPTETPPARVRIMLAEGLEVFGETIWQIGDVIGIRRSRGPDAAARPATESRIAPLDH
ncbi:MAG: hypothetical protein EON96_00160 [Caulobacteraceae bacterium]|nr:MAG: hypothetical protein EON96_00160 [Caulobacteraceae bacterium]